MIVNLRPRRSPIGFGSADDAKRYFQDEVLPALERQTSEFAVAPRVGLRLRNGELLRAGDEVTVGMLEGFPPQPGDNQRQPESPWSVLERLVREGRVLARADTPKDAA